MQWWTTVGHRCAYTLISPWDRRTTIHLFVRRLTSSHRRTTKRGNVSRVTSLLIWRWPDLTPRFLAFLYIICPSPTACSCTPCPGLQSSARSYFIVIGGKHTKIGKQRPMCAHVEPAFFHRKWKVAKATKTKTEMNENTPNEDTTVSPL